MSPLSDMCVWNIFSQSVACLFAFLKGCFGDQECLILPESLGPTSLWQCRVGPLLELCPLRGPQRIININEHIPVPRFFHFSPADFTRSGRSVLSLSQPLAPHPVHRGGNHGLGAYEVPPQKPRLSLTASPLSTRRRKMPSDRVPGSEGQSTEQTPSQLPCPLPQGARRDLSHLPAWSGHQGVPGAQIFPKGKIKVPAPLQRQEFDCRDNWAVG